MDYGNLVRATAAKYPGRTAVRCGTRSVTYAALEAEVSRIAALLIERGWQGATVASLYPNDITTIVVYLALSRAGCTSVPLDPRLVAREQSHILDDCNAKLLLADPELYADGRAALDETGGQQELIIYGPDAPQELSGSIEAFVPSDPVPTDLVMSVVDDSTIATILYTSGTTGRPKGVVRDHKASIWACVNPALGFPLTATDVQYFPMPVCGIVFFHFVMPALMAGATVVLDRKFNADVAWEHLDNDVTVAFLPPAVMNRMFASRPNPFVSDRIRAVMTAFQIPAKIRQAAVTIFGNRLVYMYGQAEAQPTIGESGTLAHDAQYVGRLMGHGMVRIVDKSRQPVPAGTVGEIVIESPAVMLRYHGLPELTQSTVVGSAVHTGDLGYLDENGGLFFAGRESQFIKSGGYRVDPVEIEIVLNSHQAVVESAVLGVEDDDWGEKVVAFVVLSTPGAASETDLLDYCKSRLAAFKKPKEIFLVPELPRTALGKVALRSLRDLSKLVSISSTERNEGE